MIKGRKRRTIFGIVMAAVARRLVPNCSADIVIYKIEDPIQNPTPRRPSKDCFHPSGIKN